MQYPTDQGHTVFFLYCPRTEDPLNALATWSVVGGGSSRQACIAGGVAVPVAWSDMRSYTHLPGELGSGSGSRGCPTPNPPEYELNPVTATGTVVTHIMDGEEATRGLSNAYYELWYRSQSAEWAQLTDGPSQTGDPVRGYLDAAGSYSIQFYYPNSYFVPALGTSFHGCPVVVPTVAFGNSFACANDDLELRVFPVDPGEKVSVLEPDETTLRPAHTVKLGRYFERASEEETSRADSPAARAYGGAYNVKDLWPGTDDPGVTIVLKESGTSFYQQGFISLTAGDARGPAAEHEMAHAMVHHHYGTDYPRSACNGNTHIFTAVTNAECAWNEGLAQFVAVTAENPPFPAAAPSGGSTFDFEGCAQKWPNGATINCSDGPHVEGRVATALWDLTDSTPNETSNGFRDDASYSFDQVIAALSTHPVTVEGFWDSFNTQNGGANRPVMFMNTLEYTALRDDSDAKVVRGTWNSNICPECHGGQLHRSADTDRPSAMSWDIDGFIEKSGTYDLWVRLPNSSDSSPALALYDVDGILQTFDQQVASGWHNVRQAGFIVFARQQNEVTLIGAAGQVVVADAILLAPTDPA